MVVEYLKAMVIVLGISALIVFVLGKLRISSVVGFLLAGILIGPYAFNLVSDPHEIELLAEIGVVLLMFTIGLEFSLKNLFQLKSIVLGGGGVQVALTIAFVVCIGYFFYAQPLKGALFDGFLVALSSTAIVFKILLDRAQMNSPHGRFSVGILIFQDLCVVPFMLLIPVLAGNSAGGNIALTLTKAALVIALILFASRWLVPFIFKQVVGMKSRELFVISIITLCLGTALLTSSMGLSLALGAFLAGMIISESEYAAQAVSDVLPFKESFTGLFFISVGMLLDLKVLAGNVVGVSVMVMVIVMIKLAAITITGTVLGNSLKNSLVSGFHLFQIGEFSFILALEGRRYGLITDDLYQAFLSASIITMIMTPFLIRGSSSIAEWIARKSPLRFLERGKGKGAAERYPGSIKDHVIIVGFGLNGGNLARVLRSMDVRYVALELNSKTVRAGKKKGEPIYYGDGTSAEVLHKIGIRNASVLVVAISDAPSTRRIVQLARSSNPHLYIIARTKYVAEVEGLKHLGANDVIPEEFETSVEIFSKVLNRLQVPVNDIRDHVDRIRQDNYLALRVVKLPRRYLVEREDILKNIVIETYRIRQGSVADEKTLKDLNLRSKTGVTVIGIERAGEVHRMPSPSLRLMVDDVLLFIGSREDIDCAVDYLDSNENEPPQCSIREDV
ncbi:MAG: Inner membrane protein YbaL [Syntrophorhabdus sp. PtaB.Bin047]|jgi:CPA2 family monovalent cation:H+ antiporter-2|nr:MAG: Inner membrane protein YbaL [Syntrophorhabdus sp. PtaB.Bin047]